MALDFDRKSVPAFLCGGGEMGRLTREFDWSHTKLGDPEGWPQSLKTTLGIILHSKFPMFLWWGSDLLCFYNDAYRPSLGNDGKHPGILGMPAFEAWPEIWDFISPLIAQVWNGSEAVFYEDLLLPIYRNGKMEDVYWTFSYSPVIDESGSTAGVLVTCTETTHKVGVLRHLQESEGRFQNLIRDAAVGVIVLGGEEMKVELVNEAYGRLIDRDVSELLDKRLFDIIPEAEEEFGPIIQGVLHTGKPVYLNNHPYQVFNNRRKITGFLDFVYQPYREGNGIITGVIILCHDVTRQVAAQLNMETAIEQLRLSREAAQLGMFDMDLIHSTMEWDSRCRTLFGISHNEPVTYDRDFVQGLHPDDRETITTVIANLFQPFSDGEYDVEYRTIGADDGRIRWVRAKGKVYFNAQGRAVRFIGSVLDITDQKIVEQRKNDFIAMVSHELKTPLTSLTGYIQLLLREMEEQGAPSAHALLKRAGIQTRKMTNLINGFLNLSRLESGKLQLRFEPLLLDEVIRMEIADVTMSSEKANLELLPCGPTMVVGDREKIGSVVNNLLSNAIKYSPANARVVITCQVSEGVALVSVADQGVGIKAEDVPHIFTRFYRVENESTRDISGFGIGLYLCAELVRNHKGKIWLESEYGVGSTFYFTIPIKVQD